MIVQKDAAYACVVELGQKALIQFKDLNYKMSIFQRTYVREVRRCTELERCIRYIEKEVIDGGAKNHIPPVDVTNTEVSLQREMYDLETRLYDLERDIRQFLQNEAQLKRNINDLKQCKSVYENAHLFKHIENTAKTELENDLEEINDVGTALTPLLEQQETPWFIAGTIDSQKQHSFERVLWRACRRTAFVRTAEIDTCEFVDPDRPGKTISKSVFIIFSMAANCRTLFSAKQYSCPKTSKERQLALADILIGIHDLNLVIQTTEKHKLELLRGAAFELPEWVRQVHLQKCIYHTLNLFTFDTSGNFFVAECWVLERKMDAVLQTLQRGVEKSGGHVRPIMNVLETGEARPTYNRNNKFMNVFQNIVDSYGIASYREINPAPFTIITFPFLFAVMFGDLGHGIILLLAGLAFIRYEKVILEMRIKDEIFNTFFNGRFIIVLMGCFSVYAGLMYNDIFSKSFNLFGSKWGMYLNPWELEGLRNKTLIKPFSIALDPALAKTGEVYYVGVDPIWYLAENKLNFVNSMKMKLSVVLGIAQMTFGVILCFLNAKFFRSYINMFTVAIPQIIFLSSIFIYLCVLIFVKWIYYSAEPADLFGYSYPGSNCAPSLLIGLINMFMFRKRRKGFIDPQTNMPYYNCHLSQWYPHQAKVEATLVTIALLCIPVMLMGKPLGKLFSKQDAGTRNRKVSTRKLNKSKNVNVRVTIDSEEAELISPVVSAQPDAETPEHNGSTFNPKASTKKHKPVEEGVKANGDEADMKMVDLVVHQAIHTIEFVLGCVSHTASYLRLWALSLAHAQLSEVLWHMVLAPSFSIPGWWGVLAVFVAFFVFFVMTVSILVLMEGLSAFLHALRLHWVEFQSKFYEGAGFPFMAFSLKNSLKKLCVESEVY
uniref:V-type proton ATPase subunit a n=1 Tax=Ditylenchus dipsaci TaxID=166011 RepID=A0A915DBS8_9BILA